MKKLLSVLVSMTLLNLLLPGLAQGSTETESLASMKHQISEAEKAITVQKAQLLKNEDFLSWFEDNFQDPKRFANFVGETELLLDKLRLEIIEAEQNLSNMRAYMDAALIDQDQL